MKHTEEEHRSNSHDDEHSCKDDRSPEQESLKPVQLPTGDSHN